MAVPISPPDRRVRVFVSSTLEELAPERRAARAAITRLRLSPVMFELGARPHPPRDLYRSYLAASDVFVGIYGDHYGWTAPDMTISGLEDEYRLAGDRPRLLYLRTPAPDREPALTGLIERMWADGRFSTTPFRDPEDLAERIANDLAALLTERFDAAVADGGAPPELAPEPVPVPTSSLVGRQAEVERIQATIRTPGVRLVTLTGPGGIGKTRVALEVAGRIGPPEREVVCFADLSGLREPALFASALAAALGIRSEGAKPLIDVVADRLAGRPTLLVLDNFEHVLPAAADVAKLLANCPHTSVLVTSRSVLHLHGEHEFPLAPLPAPPAAELFLDRVREVRPGFEPGPEDGAAVAEIVRRLEGVPLALELAAARTRLLPPRALLARLDRLDLRSSAVDAPARQQTLRATVAWSYDLLDAGGQRLLRRLSVFADGWSLEGAEAVAGGDVLETLSDLVGHSLVAPDGRDSAEPRFRMLDLVREFARERLTETGEADATADRLAGFVAGLAARAGAALGGPEAREWTARVDAELEAFRSVLDRAVATDDAALAVRVTAPLQRYWWSRGLLGEMRDVAERTASLPSAARLPAADAGRLGWTRATIRIALGRPGEAGELLTGVAADARARDDRPLLAQALFSLALTLPHGTEAEVAAVRAHLEESAALFRALEDDWGTALALIPLGDLALLGGDVATAAPLHEEALRRARRLDDDHMHAAALDQVAVDALLSGHPDQAREHLAEAAALHTRLRDYEGIANGLAGFAAVALTSGDALRAAFLLGTAARVREVAGVAVWPLLAPLTDRLADAARAAAGDAWAEHFAAGREAEPLATLAAPLTPV